LGAGTEIPFNIAFFDPSGNLLKNVQYGFTITDETGKELLTRMGSDPNNPGILASEGIHTQSIFIPSNDVYKIQMAIFGQDSGTSVDLKYSGIASGFFEVGPSGQKIVPPASIPASPAKERVPVWIKNNAKWWSEGQIGEADFVNGIQFLIKEKIINIPDLPEQASETAKEKVPDWIKNNAGWWANGLISEDDFVNGIKYLVENGIISV
ncbi:MAG: peptidase, partial [Thaumarchaeota archaeon]|nr:peptidase [Nitrososphaerota archaeon]